MRKSGGTFAFSDQGSRLQILAIGKRSRCIVPLLAEDNETFDLPGNATQTTPSSPLVTVRLSRQGRHRCKQLQVNSPGSPIATRDSRSLTRTRPKLVVVGGNISHLRVACLAHDQFAPLALELGKASKFNIRRFVVVAGDATACAAYWLEGTIAANGHSLGGAGKFGDRTADRYYYISFLKSSCIKRLDSSPDQ